MSRNLLAGLRGGDVRNLQMLLNRHCDPKNRLDLAIDEDGVFGPQTNARVRVFQERCGLVPDGIVGSKTGDMLLPERTITLQAVVSHDDDDFSSRFAPAAQRSLFGFAPNVARAGIGAQRSLFGAAPTVVRANIDPPGPTPPPPPAAPTNQRFAQFQILAGGQQAFNPKIGSPLVVTAQYNLIIRNPGRPDFTLTTGLQFALNVEPPKGQGPGAGDFTGQGFGQMGLALNKKVIGGRLDLFNPFVVTMLQRNQGQPFNWGIGIGNQTNFTLDRAGRLALFFNAQGAMNIDLSNGRASAPGLQILGGISVTLGQLPPDPP